MTEIWKPIKGYEDQYEVSNLGRVRQCRILKLSENQDGYQFVGLSHNKVKVIGYVHKLVCEAFNGPKPFPEAQCLHSDDVKAHNYAENVYWGTFEQNQLDKIRNGKTAKGEDNPLSKLTWDKVREIRQLYSSGNTNQSWLARKFEVTVSCIHHIVHNRTWVEP